MSANAAVKQDDDFTPEQIADFWESIEEERSITVRWLSDRMKNDEGLRMIEETASILAQRHGFSHDIVKNFRSVMRAASEKEGHSPPLTLKKTKTPTGHYMAVVSSKPHSSPRKTGEELVLSYLSGLLDRGKVSKADIEEACRKLGVI